MISDWWLALSPASGKEMAYDKQGCCRVEEGAPPGATGRFAPPFPNGRRARSSILLGTLSSSENATAVGERWCVKE